MALIEVIHLEPERRGAESIGLVWIGEQVKEEEVVGSVSQALLASI